MAGFNQVLPNRSTAHQATEQSAATIRQEWLELARFIVMLVLLGLMGVSYTLIIINHWRQRPLWRLLWLALTGSALVLLGAGFATDVIMPGSVIGWLGTFRLCLLMVAGGGLMVPLTVALVRIEPTVDRFLMSRPLPAESVPDDVKQRVISSLKAVQATRKLRWLVFDTLGTQRFVAYRMKGTYGALMYDASASPDGVPAKSFSPWGCLLNIGVARGVGMLSDGRTVPLNVRNGFWWVFPPDAQADWDSFEFYNRRGRRLYTLRRSSPSGENQDPQGE